MNLTPAQIKTLNTLIARGGEMNGFAGQKGFYCNSVRPLARMGLVENVADCASCSAENVDIFAQGHVCDRPLPTPSRGARMCYQRLRITDAGRAAAAAKSTTAARPLSARMDPFEAAAVIDGPDVADALAPAPKSSLDLAREMTNRAQGMITTAASLPLAADAHVEISSGQAAAMVAVAYALMDIAESLRATDWPTSS